MDYTRNRGYPIPSSERETGNGGLHSELLARAVAADLDVLDPAWAAEMQHATQILTMSADQTGFSANSDRAVLFDTISKQTTGLGLNSNQVLHPARGGDGWYHICCDITAQASGTITAGALHRMSLRVFEDQANVQVARDTYYTETLQIGVQAIWCQIEAMVLLRYGDNNQVWPYWVHTNTGSTVTIVASGSYLTATKIMAA